MVPPEAITGSLLMEEADRIKGAILDVQTQVQAVTESTEHELFADIRTGLGYPETGLVNDTELVDTRVQKQLVIPPGAVEAVLPLTRPSAKTTREGRQAIGNILLRNDNRLMVVVGPCSIHDPEAALEYAERAGEWRGEYGSHLEVVMRTYMEKPRSELGWKGMIYDPRLDGSDDINLGIVMTRMIAGQITAGGVPIAVERLNALTPQYVNGLVAYDAIGARNTTDQKAREYASGTSSPVGFKNTPDGNVTTAAEAVVAANGPHAFLGMGMNGLPNQVNTAGNPLAHIILRGGEHGPNYSAEGIQQTKAVLAAKRLLEAIVVDASHGNSGKIAAQQMTVIESVGEQLESGEVAIRGVMIESNLVGGKQKLDNPEDLVYGQSITDECINLNETELMLDVLARAAAARA